MHQSPTRKHHLDVLMESWTSDGATPPGATSSIVFFRYQREELLAMV